MDISKKRLQSSHGILSQSVKKRLKTDAVYLGHQVQKSAVPTSTRIIHDEVLLYPPGTPISYSFHSCDAALIREALHRIHAEDIPLNINLSILTFSLPKTLDDDGSAVPWLVTLITCFAWCFHDFPVPSVIITAPELCLKDPYIAVNEKELLPSLRTDLYTGSTSRQLESDLLTTATDLVATFLVFTQGLPELEMDTEEQVIFALADFLHDSIERCKSCVLWRAAWKECLNRIYGKEVARTMARRRKFQPTCG